MSYGTPYESGNREYQVRLRSTTTINNGEYYMHITCNFGDEAMDTQDFADKFQQFVDFLGDGGDNFVVLSATRVKHYTEDVTATP